MPYLRTGERTRGSVGRKTQWGVVMNPNETQALGEAQAALARDLEQSRYTREGRAAMESLRRKLATIRAALVFLDCEKTLRDIDGIASLVAASGLNDDERARVTEPLIYLRLAVELADAFRTNLDDLFPRPQS